MTQVNASTTSGDMGILSAHVPSVESLKPGLLEVIESSGSKKFFGASEIGHIRRRRRRRIECADSLSGLLLVSGGFLVMHPNNKLTINAIEAYPLEEFSPEVRHVLLCHQS